MPRKWCVAVSGGVDSTVLLHSMARSVAAQRGQELRAVHVHHGLYPDAERWTELAQAHAREVACPFRILRVEVACAGGESLEACARRARYEALSATMAEGEVLLTGHHQDDQLETVMLQLLRGAGVAGLAAMPPLARFEPGWLCRPLLGFSRQELTQWAQQEQLDWVEEPSNLDLRFDRNYLRHRVLPSLRDRWPSAARSVSRSARYCAEAKDLLQDLAREDLERADGPDTLDAQSLLELSAQRRNNLLRYWLSWRGLPTPPARVLEHVQEQLLGARAHAMPCLAWAGGQLRRYRDRVFAMATLPEPPRDPMSWLPGRDLALPAPLGVLSLVPGRDRGLDPRVLEGASLEVRFRHGGERMALAGRHGHHALRKLFQEYGVLPWMRERLPLLYINGKLAAVADLWVDEDFTLRVPGAALELRWSGHPEVSTQDFLREKPARQPAC